MATGEVVTSIEAYLDSVDDESAGN